MNELLKRVLSLSLSGSLVILLLALCRPLLRTRLSRRWQSYIWLVAVVRLLLPAAPAGSPIGALFQDRPPAAVQLEADGASAPVTPAETAMPSGAREPAPQSAGERLPDHLWLIWLGIALALLLRKLTLYQSFVRYVRAGQEAVSQVERLDALAEIGAEIGVRRPVELAVNRAVSSPLLVGLLRPCIVLPGTDLPDADFRYTVLHELAHWRRGDMLCKQLVQIAVCLHWFNPLVWWMAREMDRACELACDEAVLRRLAAPERRAYGDTLLRAMEAGCGCKSAPGAVPLSGGAKLLKERLDAIMTFRQRPKYLTALSLALAAVLTVGAAAAGAYTGPAGQIALPAVSAAKRPGRTPDRSRPDPAAQAERFYEAGSLPLFAAVFGELDGDSQRAWLERLYDGGDFLFFSTAVRSLEEGSPLLADFAERAYAAGSPAWFSALAGCMDGAALEDWLDRALGDGDFTFQSTLFHLLDKDEELETLEKELDRQLAAEYAAHGVTLDGKNRWYRGELVRIFLDFQPGSAFYCLDINPKGTVDLKIVRENGAIQAVIEITRAEAAELLNDWMDGDGEEPGLDQDAAAGTWNGGWDWDWD